MSLYAIGDLHLSLSANKPMDIFGGRWNGYMDKLRRGFSKLRYEDVTVLCGDISWATDLPGAKEDFLFIDSLPGKKIILKGNHDYWWTTLSKLGKFFLENNISTISFLHNNCAFYQDIAISGTRGWFFEDEAASQDEKIYRRELMRLEMSLKAAAGKETFCFLHYPPLYKGYVCAEIIELMRKYNVTRCFYGHLHGDGHRLAVEGEREGVFYSMVSADYLDFCPLKIL